MYYAKNLKTRIIIAEAPTLADTVNLAFKKISKGADIIWDWLVPISVSSMTLEEKKTYLRKKKHYNIRIY